MALLGESLAVRYSGGDDSDIPQGGYQGEYLKDWSASLREACGDGLVWERDSQTFIRFAEEKAMEMIRGDLALLGIDFDRFFELPDYTAGHDQGRNNQQRKQCLTLHTTPHGHHHTQKTAGVSNSGRCGARIRYASRDLPFFHVGRNKKSDTDTERHQSP